MKNVSNHLVPISHYRFSSKEASKPDMLFAVSDWLIVNFSQSDIRFIDPKLSLQQSKIHSLFFPAYKESGSLTKTAIFRFLNKAQLATFPVVFSIPELETYHTAKHVCIQHYHPDLSISVLILFAENSPSIYQCLDHASTLRQFTYNIIEKINTKKLNAISNRVYNLQPMTVKDQPFSFPLPFDMKSVFQLNSFKCQDVVILALLYNDICNTQDIASYTGLSARSVDYRLQKMYNAFKVSSKLELSILIYKQPEILQSLFFSLKK